jgi:hypothetical protein
VAGGGGQGDRLLLTTEGDEGLKGSEVASVPMVIPLRNMSVEGGEWDDALEKGFIWSYRLVNP